MGDNASVACLVLSIVAAEAAGGVKVTDVVGMGVPAGLHLREHIFLIKAFDLCDGGIDLGSVLC